MHFRFIRTSAIAFAVVCGCACAGFAQPVIPGAATPAPLAAPSPQASTPAAASPIERASASATEEPSPTPTPKTGRRLAAFKVTADHIVFYSNRFIMTANGHVSLKLGDGTRITGNTFAYDLRLNRLLIAGAVRITAAKTDIDGAAFAEYFDFDRAYFLPILSEPDRWTFAEGNYSHPLFGRQMPGDTFFLPDLAGERVFLYAKSATVDPKQSIRFSPATINFGLAFVPFPSYFLNYSPNPFFAQNALTGAFVDGPLDFAGGEHGLATAHVRYDNLDGVFPALEVHQVSDNHYLVLSGNSLTRPLKQYNLLAYDRISPGLQFQSQFQENAYQHDLSRPLSATGYVNMQLTGSLPHSYVQLTEFQYYDSLLARPDTYGIGAGGVKVYYYGDPTHNFVPDHPSNTTLNWIGVRNEINALPVYYQVRSSFGLVEDSLTPLQTLGNVPYYTEYNKALGIDLTTKSLPIITDKSGRHHDTYFTATFDRQREWFSLPHHVDTQIVTASITKIFDPQVTVLATYRNTNTGDFYGAQQLQAYPANTNSYNPYTGQSIKVSPGFRGFGTSRSFSQQLVYVPSEAIAFTATMRENDDFPRPLPGGLPIVGDARSFMNFGVTPLEADFDVRFRISRVLVLDVSRSNFFGFGGFERWSPQFSFQVEK